MTTPGTGVLNLNATWGSGYGWGYYGITVNRGIDVTPDAAVATSRATNGGLYTETFTVKNIGAITDTFALTCAGSGGAVCTAPTPTQLILSAGVQSSATASYYTEAAGTGTLKLFATGRHVGSDSGWFSVPIVPVGVSVTPDSGAATPRAANAGPFTETFTVQNTGTTSQTYTLACTGSSNVTCSSTSPSATVTVAANASAPVTATYSVGAIGTGTLTLTASVSDANDAGSFRVPVIAATQQAPSVVVDAVNPGNITQRDLCMKIALGQAAASECGDLRIVHALPTTRSMNKARTPTLLYNSQFAHPYPLVAALVTLPTSAIPDSIEAVLTVNGTIRRTQRWGGAQWATGGTQRIAVGFDGMSDTTGLYPYSLEVAAIYGGTRLATAAAGQLAVVNRNTSPFGTGWWLAGLEHLNVATMLWVGGDGSMHQYLQVPGTSDQWVAPALDHPDTLKRVITDSTYYVRYLGGGVEVWFSPNGSHKYTYNRQRHRTAFLYDPTSKALTTITLPSGSTALTYQFAYTASAPYHLLTVTAPPIGAIARITTVTEPTGFVSQIQDPDGVSVYFSALAGIPELIQTRADRRGAVVTFPYDALGARKIAGSSLNMGAGNSPIVLTITPQEILGSGAQSVDPANAFTLIDGPRTDSADVTKIWADRWGEPVLTQDAHGSQTRLVRGDARWPALVTELDRANGWKVAATYDARGNIASTTDFGFGGHPTTSYQWDQHWDAPTLIKRPEGDSVVMAYDATTGNRLWQQDGRGSTTRVTFGYNTSNQLTTITPPATAAEVMAYDPLLGNTSTVTSSKGYDAKYVTDAIGRTTELDTRIDTVPNNPSPLYRALVTSYDLIGRDTLQKQVGPPIGSVASETVFVRKYFNPDGQVDSLRRWSDPDVAGIGTIRTRWSYDLAGRPVAEFAPDDSPNSPRVDSTFYDPIGNVTAAKNRRGYTITMIYDALNRLVTRSLPAVSYASRNSNIINPPQDPYPAYQIAAETQAFAYDALSRVVEADNADAKVKRTYFPNGLVETDSSWIQTVNHDDWTKHVYGLRNVYDRDGRRIALAYPQQLSATGLSGTMTFAYEPQLGVLQTVYDPQGNRYDFAYTVRGELASIVFPGQYSEAYTYDADGRVVADTLRNLGGTAFPRLGAALVRATTYNYDAQGRMVHSADPGGWQDTLGFAYSGLGHLASTSLFEHAQLLYASAFGYANVPSRISVREAFTFDALGNRTYGETRDSTWINGQFSSMSYSTHGTTYAAGTGRTTLDAVPGGITSYSYDAAGNTEFTSDQGSQQGSAEERASFYGPGGQLRAVDWRWVGAPTQFGGPTKEAFDEYRYDALGRRIWVWSHKSCYEASMLWYEASECKSSLIRRTVWDGDDILAEVQMPGGTGADETPLYENDVATVQLADLQFSHANAAYGDRNQYFGRVLYTPGRGVDQPVAVTRVNFEYQHDDNGADIAYKVLAPITTMPFWDVKGDPRVGAFTAGAWGPGPWRLCNPPTTSPGDCVSVVWSALWSAFDRHPGIWDSWHGTILESQRDKTGQTYMRNRYYDPQTGRFTQEDRIGLAGGMNLYGFAKGDPVNFGDPFGDSTFVNCRAAKMPWGHGPSKTFAHCAVRVKNRNIDVTFQLTPDAKLWLQPDVGASGPSESATKEFKQAWVPVAVPTGVTSDRFDQLVLASVTNYAGLNKGMPYNPFGEGNSNNFVYRVITQAGGRVPIGVSTQIGKLVAPGICGGEFLHEGSSCGP